MTNQSKTNERPEFFSGTGSTEAFQREFIQVPMAAARQPAIKTGLDLLAFMSAMPDVFLASEQRELRRLARTSDDKNDPRIERLKMSIERASELSSTAKLGKTRIERVIAAMSNEENVFHGFVSDTNLKPREKLTVRISGVRGGDTTGDKETKSLSTTTDADGYFSISLDNRKTDPVKKATSESGVKLSDQMEELLSRVNAKTETVTDSKSGDSRESYSNTSNQNQVLVQVEILDEKNVIYQDSSPLVVNDGIAYREYVIDGSEPTNPKEPNRPNPAKSAEAKAEKSEGTSSKSAVKTSATPSKPASPTTKATGTKTKK